MWKNAMLKHRQNLQLKLEKEIFSQDDDCFNFVRGTQSA